ncbi:hypothetical protein [Oceanobacter sp. 4_MG-2023]|uniref:hypothetical protein n=1 Tax=Oceanobacter sp. 4_MG-2023 TaxID=3062623 RepID=UPI002736A69B|nr:hypothetical protein [Oceanobacter sp. 4_MG-2023]MDP2548065.1 hypothetical protein [Oceanobacter sp. 4_MG-2023]
MKFLIFLLVIMLSSQAFAGSGSYHVCTDARGHKTFSSEPCAANQKSEVKTYKVSDGVASTANARLSTDNPSYQSMRISNRRYELERSIKKSERELEGLQGQMDSELAKLKKKQNYANNNLAGATYRQSLATEMQSVTEQYKLRIESVQDELNRQRFELSELSE